MSFTIMQKNALQMNCPICHESLYAGLGKSCKMCGMVLADQAKDFCSRLCRAKYAKIRQNQQLQGFINKKILIDNTK